MGGLTTHVLDTALGAPAEGLWLELFSVDNGHQMLTATRTNADGRCEAPLLEGDALVEGRYELVFHAGDYLRSRHGLTIEPLFLDQVPVRFGITDPDSHYHVPLLLSPYGYSVYRGS